ncbi:phage minor head protein [Pseudomonas sp. XS1P51]
MQATAKTHPSHRALHGQVFRHDDPIWASIFPPSGFNCRRRVIALSEAPWANASIERRKGIHGNSRSRHQQTYRRSSYSHGYRYSLKRRPRPAITFRTDPGFNHSPGSGLVEAIKRKQAFGAQGARNVIIEVEHHRVQSVLRQVRWVVSDLSI